MKVVDHAGAPLRHAQRRVGRFEVAADANKTQIKQAIETLFKKTVVAVNTCNYAGKKKRERTASFGRKADWKKAIVTLKAGDKIELA